MIWPCLFHLWDFNALTHFHELTNKCNHYSTNKCAIKQLGKKYIKTSKQRTINFACEEESNKFRQYLYILVKIDSSLTKDDPKQHWTNNCNYENKESILTINKTKGNWTNKTKLHDEPPYTKKVFTLTSLLNLLFSSVRTYVFHMLESYVTI